MSPPIVRKVCTSLNIKGGLLFLCGKQKKNESVNVYCFNHEVMTTRETNNIKTGSTESRWIMINYYGGCLEIFFIFLFFFSLDHMIVLLNVAWAFVEEVK